MDTLENKLIIYDSNCKVCTSLRGWIIKLTSIPENKIVAYKDLKGELIQKVDPEMFKNVMALIDIKGEETIYGAEGVAYIFGNQYRILNLLLKISMVRSIFTFLYKTLAYNRYVVATPKNNISCDCFPDNVRKYRLSYIAITFSISLSLATLLGVSLQSFFPGMTTIQAALEMLLIAVSGWGLQVMIAVILNRKNALEYIGHLGSITVVCLIVYIPWMLVHFMFGFNMVLIPLVSLGIANVLLLYLHIQRTKYLQISLWWTVSRFLTIIIVTVFWTYYFHAR